MATKTTLSSRHQLPARFLLFGDRGNGCQQLGKTRTWEEAERLQQDLAWVYRIDSGDIEILEDEETHGSGVDA